MSGPRRGLAIALCCMGLVAQTVAAEPLDGAVSGRLANGTAQGATTVGDTVSLLIFGVKEQAQTGERQTILGPDGGFTFTGLDRDPNVAYFLLAEHQGITYSNPQPFQLKDEPTRQADITVYDTTTSDRDLRFERTNLLVTEADPGMLQLMQMGTLVNVGDRTFVTENPGEGVLARGIRFGLPRGALNAQVQAGFDQSDVLPAVDGIQVASPMRPGRQQFALSFQLPFNGSSADIGLQLSYPADAFSLYAPLNGARLESTQLQSQGQANLGGQTYALYGMTSVERNTVVGARLANLPSVGGSGLSNNQLTMIGLGVALFVLGAGTLLFGTRPRPAAAGPRSGETSAVEEERLRLVVKLAALDERFAAGEVTANDYHAERERGKERLLELTRALRQTESPA